MISGTLKKKYTLEGILEHYSEYDIFKYYIGHFVIGEITSNPKENQRTPSFLVSDRSGHLMYMDFSDDSVKGNIVEFIKWMYPGKEYNDALESVVNDLGGANVVRTSSPPKRKGKAFIQVTQRAFDTADLEYWKGYYQTRRDLEENNVFAIKAYSVNGTRRVIPSTELAFGYLCWDNAGEAFWKIYRPLADKHHKWLYSGSNTFIHGLENMRLPGKGIITKSFKDYLVIKKIIERTCATQSESLDCFTKDSIGIICWQGQDNNFLGYDNDEAGRKARKKVCQVHRFSYIHTPDDLLPVKDFADMARLKGLKAVEDYFKLNNII